MKYCARARNGTDRVNDPQPVIKGIDHLIVMVRDLDRSDGLWKTLGVRTTARGFHDRGGTANHLVMLDGTYVELLGTVDHQRAFAYWAMMDEAPGLWGIALRGSAEAAFRLWGAAGLEPAAPASLSRAIDIAGHTVLARFQLTTLPQSPELPLLVFCCEHLTPQYVWEPGAPQHPNGARTLREVVLVVADDRARQAFERIIGHAAVTAAGGSATIQVGECRLAFLPDAEFERRFGMAAMFRACARPMIAAVTIASADLAGARQWARRAGVPVRSSPAGGFAVTLAQEGVVVEWVPA